MQDLAQITDTTGQPLKKRLLQRHATLVTERASWITHAQQVSQFLLPRNGRFCVSDRNRGGNRWNNIIDSSGTRGLRVMAAGLMSGATSPARPWFRMQTADADLNEYYPVKVWLDESASRVRHAFARSNTYRALHQIYEELGAFGTGATIVLPDYDRAIHHYPQTFGEFCLADDFQGRVNVFYREFETTAGAMVREFGLEKCSDPVQQQVAAGNFEARFKIVHAIEPRTDRERKKGSLDNTSKPWRSVYFEPSANCEKILRESGFDRFPVLAPRWATAGGDIYGHSPGMEALGDIKQLQHEQTRKGQAIDFQTKPPLQGPASMKNRDVELLPGGFTAVDSANATKGVSSMFDVRLDLQHLLLDIEDVRRRIRESFYADLFLMMANDTRSNVTATEIAERHEEKLLMLGPVLERLHTELLEPLVEMTFERLLHAGALPPPPPELSGMDINIEFVSVLAQAQRAIGLNNIDRFMGNIGAAANLDREVLDNIDFDAYPRLYGDAAGVDPRLLRKPEDVQRLRKARNAALAAKEQAGMMAATAKTAKDFAAAPTNGKNALTDMMNQLQGYGSPSGTEV